MGFVSVLLYPMSGEQAESENDGWGSNSDGWGGGSLSSDDGAHKTRLPIDRSAGSSSMLWHTSGMPEAAPLPGCEWWQKPLLLGLEHVRSRMGEQLYPLKTDSIFTGTWSEGFTFKAF